MTSFENDEIKQVDNIFKLISDFFTLNDCFLLSCQFLKEKEGKAFHLRYQERVLLSAYAKQVSHGPFDPNASPEVGWLDVVGSDRRTQWQSLGSLSKDKAQTEFIKLLDHSSVLLRPYLEAHRKEKEDKILGEKRAAEEKERQLTEERRRHLMSEEELRRKAEQLTLNESLVSVPLGGDHQSNGDDIRRAQIRAALNQQTSHQFRQYAEEQHPKDLVKQEELVRQLQEQHYQQYMTQVYQQQLRHQEQQVRQLNSQPQGEASRPVSECEAQPNGEVEHIQDYPRTASESNYVITPPAMWTHRELTASKFKANLASDTDAKLKIGPGEVVTVRVPTHEDGASIVWEFATDYYDIGFGVYFEWTISPSDKVTVHISESSDEEEDDEENDAAVVNGNGEAVSADPEVGVRRKRKEDLPIDEIVPVYRRDSHEEVYCGSHQYPGRGVYLLKFDNSYSLWRSKWLYYRVYYTR